MAYSADLRIDKALERLNVSREKQKIILKRKQETVVKELLTGRDVMVILPTGFGKSKNCGRKSRLYFLSREGGRLCFIVTSEAEDNISC